MLPRMHWEIVTTLPTGGGSNSPVTTTIVPLFHCLHCVRVYAVHFLIHLGAY